MLFSWSFSRKQGKEGIRELVGSLGDGFHFVYYTPDYDPEDIVRLMGSRPFIGCSSFVGVFTPEGFLRAPAICALTVPEDAAEVKPVAAKNPEGLKAKLKGMAAPGAAWLHSTPGIEERVIGAVVGALGGLPLLGGSAGDNDLSGAWSVVAEGFWAREGAVLALVYPKVKTGYAFVGGYLPVGPWGKVTRAQGRRIFEIDGEPAAQVYNRWTGGLIEEHLGEGGVVLPITTLEPLGIRTPDGVILAHPERVYPDGSLGVFVEVEPGAEIGRMKVTERGLVQRPKDMIARAKDRGGLSKVYGGVMVYCAGCINTVMESADQVAKGAAEEAGAPVLGPATFGEQGVFVRRDPRHGNLMSSVLLFGE